MRSPVSDEAVGTISPSACHGPCGLGAYHASTWGVKKPARPTLPVARYPSPYGTTLVSVYAGSSVVIGAATTGSLDHPSPVQYSQPVDGSLRGARATYLPGANAPSPRYPSHW